ncbi:MAG: hypothetical protein K6C08_03105 [Oscillospiraceae bacterium]|nr:hypothetical protein [Oscillospiraceae bacterium]
MTENIKSIRRAEALLIVLFLLLLLLFQILGSGEKKTETVRDISSVEDLADRKFAAVVGSNRLCGTVRA